MAKRRGNKEGSIYQRTNGRWRTQISINGRRYSHSANTHRECQDWLRTKLHQIDRVPDPSKGQIRLSEYLLDWLKGYRVAIRETTYQRYKGNIDKYIIPYLGRIALQDLKKRRIEEFYFDLLEGGVGVRTIRHTHAVLHRSLEKAVLYGYLFSNPASRVTLPKYRPAEMQVLDESQVTDLLVAASGSRHTALYQLAVTTGMRQGELFGLKWADLHPTRMAVHIQRQVQRITGGGWKFTEPKTKSGRRVVQLGEGTIHALGKHRVQQRSQKALSGKRWHENDLIFPSSVGTPLNSSNLRKDFISILERAGLPRIRFHDLRHTAASIMLNRGIPVLVVSRILGHSKPSVTLDIYGHLYHEMQGEAARVMDEVITPIAVEFTEPGQEVIKSGENLQKLYPIAPELHQK